MSKAHNENYYMVSLTCESKEFKFIEAEHRTVDSTDWVMGELQRYWLNGTNFSYMS